MQALNGLTQGLKTILSSVDDEIQRTTREICLRADRPLIISAFNKDWFWDKQGFVREDFNSNVYIVSKSELEECVKILTEYSIHSYKDKINMGFITINGGHRAGIVGSCISSDDKVIAITNISSINLRIARQIKGVAASVIKTEFKDGLCSMLIVGSPASGKTTMLRDITYSLSQGVGSKHIKLALIDERGEIAAVKDGIPQNDVGIFTDVLDGYSKGIGMMIAIRSMSPKAIVIDEIGSEEDANSIRQSINAGVKIIATAHAGSLDELMRKKHIMRLIQECAFDKIIILGSADKPCTVVQVINTNEIKRFTNICLDAEAGMRDGGELCQYK